MDSSIHQSFINLIYPSKSKKKLANESAISNMGQVQQPQKYSESNIYNVESKERSINCEYSKAGNH